MGQEDLSKNNHANKNTISDENDPATAKTKMSHTSSQEFNNKLGSPNKKSTHIPVSNSTDTLQNDRKVSDESLRGGNIKTNETKNVSITSENNIVQNQNQNVQNINGAVNQNSSNNNIISSNINSEINTNNNNSSLSTQNKDSSHISNLNNNNPV